MQAVSCHRETDTVHVAVAGKFTFSVASCRQAFRVNTENPTTC